MNGAATLALALAGGASLAAWLAVLVRPARPWDLRPAGEEGEPPPALARWPAVAVVVPARNEEGYLPRTLPALLEQDYPGPWQALVVDDRSSDATAETAERLGVAVSRGAPLPPGWVGKVWALEQGVRAAGGADYLLLTDADVRHAPGSLRRLVAECEAGGLALNSRTARLRCCSSAERLLIPPFLFFFNLLYPMRRVNDPRARLAAAAGGCMLVRRDALERAGGLARMRGAVIDDVTLARLVKRLGEPIRLAVSRREVESLREYETVGAIWRMVRRTAFAQLRRSLFLLAATLAALAVTLVLPPLLVAFAVGLAVAGEAGAAAAVGVPAALAWTAMAVAFTPTVRYFGLSRAWAWTLPVAGLLYAAMTVDSAGAGPGARG